jgi:hypothetical protein
MSVDANTPRSRRSVIAAAAGAAAAATVATIGGPLAVFATDGDPLLAGQVNEANTTTVLRGAGLVVESFQDPDSPVSGDAVRGRAGKGSGVAGVTEGPAWGAHTAGVFGLSAVQQGYGVVGWNAEHGVGLYVRGKVKLSTRSGRALIRAGRASVDIDLRATGGLSGTPLGFANLVSYRPGVHVAAVRPNYPVAGKARIYLNRSVTADTYVAWFVLN